MTQRGRMKRNKSDKHPPKLSTKPKAGGNVSPQQQTAAGKGSCPRSPPGAAAQAPHRGATAAAAPAQNCLPSTQKPPPPPARAEAPAAPLRPGFLPFPLPPSLPSPLPPLRQRLRLPDTGASPPPAGAVHTSCRDKNPPGPPPPPSPPRCDPPRPPRDAPVPQRGQQPLCSLKAGGGGGGGDGDRAAPRTGSHPQRGRKLILLLFLTPPERGAVGGGCPCPRFLSPVRGGGRAAERSPARGWMRHAWPLAPAVPRRSLGG